LTLALALTLALTLALALALTLALTLHGLPNAGQDALLGLYRRLAGGRRRLSLQRLRDHCRLSVPVLILGLILGQRLLLQKRLGRRRW
jgi:hypothetical protein